MMILRTAGLLSLSLSFIAFGAWRSRRSSNDCRALSDLVQLIAHIRREIVFDRTELPACFSSFFEDASPQKEPFIQGDYRRALSFYRLPEDLNKEMTAFFESLGKEDAREEERRCDKALSLLTDRAEKQQKALPGKKKVSLTLGVCAAAILLLLFW